MKAVAAVAIILLLGLVPPAFAKDGRGAQAKEIFPELYMPETVYDFKTVLEGKMVAYMFPVKNKGRAPLIITEIKTTCGCTVASYTKGEIPPGGFGEVTLRFNSNRYGGKLVTKSAYVYSNDPKSSKVKLRLTGKVVKLADINPESISLRGSPGEPARTVVEIIPSEEYPFHIIGEPKTGKDTYRCGIEEHEGKYTLTVENLAKKPMVYADSVILKTDRPEEPEIRIRVIGKIEAKNED